MNAFDIYEAQRINLQKQLDGRLSSKDRNKVGQFATPSRLAHDMLTFAATLMNSEQPVRFLDPAFGTGAFYSALLQTFAPSRICRATGYEIDPFVVAQAQDVWAETSLALHHADFTRLAPPRDEENRYNLIICNPPYVRHHHLFKTEKARLQRLLPVASIKLSELAGLYCYFLLLADRWLAQGGIAGWLIPGEFMDVNYGKALKHYLTQEVTLLRIHRFAAADIQFSDALVSSTLVWFKKAAPTPTDSVEFTYERSLQEPQHQTHIMMHSLAPAAKWTTFFQAKPLATVSATRLGDLFRISRGIATGANHYFIVSADDAARHQLPREFLFPILPSARRMPLSEIATDRQGEPILAQKLYLLSCTLPEYEVQQRFPALHTYFEEGKRQKIHLRYLCAHRSPWYAQEHRAAPPFLCTYMGRQTKGNPFRFILNHSQAIAANTYLLLYPRPSLQHYLQSQPTILHDIWAILNEISTEVLIGEGRVYGGGLHKLEPKELANIPVAALQSVLPSLSLWPSHSE